MIDATTEMLYRFDSESRTIDRCNSHGDVVINRLISPEFFRIFIVLNDGRKDGGFISLDVQSGIKLFNTSKTSL